MNKPMSPEKMQNIIDQQMDMLKAYKSRQDFIVMGLGQIQKNPDKAAALIVLLLEGTLKQAKERVNNNQFALKIAVNALQVHEKEDKDFEGTASEPFCRHGDFGEELKQIQALAPEAFEPETVGASA